MKKIYKFLSVGLVIAMLMSFAGCGNKEERLPASDEKIIFSYENDEYKVSTSKQTVTVEKGGNLVMVASMVSEDGMQQYLDANKDNSRILEFGVTRGLRYVDCEQIVEDKKEYVKIGWVIGTNTGIIFNATGNRVDMTVALKDVNISCASTKQTDPLYYSYKIDDFIGSSSSQLEKID
jgi:vacuolar-type H+-ATPase subunit B/Vma2